MTKTLPLVLCPGLLCDAALWAPQIEALRDLAEIYIPDVAQEDTMSGMGAAVLSAAPWPQFALAGLSMGGYVALEAFMQAPRRVTRLALLDARARPETAADRARRDQLIALVQRERGFATLTRQLLPLMVHASRLDDAGLRDTLVGMAERTGVEVYARQQRAIVSRRDFRPLLRHVDVPTLVLCGCDDQITPLDCSEEMAAAIPDATLVAIEDCGHLSTLEAPAAVNAAMRRWLAA
ncbi:MAG TPA: alpha/beta fold hydrolase [Gammaproteobacteria bacterium]|nr:alpha/beta fold hydrolase [Gammaproteobacteria bacterium]